MAYNAVSQADLELASNATDSDASRGPSPQPHHPASFEQLPLDTDNIGGGRFMQSARTEEDSSIRRLGSMIRSMTSTSYDMVEEDDYELVVADPSAKPTSNSPSSPNYTTTNKNTTTSPHRLPALDTTAQTNDHADIRTPNTDHSVPLSHPTPGLQSLQGAYLNNVERLEKSAERLSLSSADIGSEIRKMDLEQKRRSSGSASNYVLSGNPDASRRGSIQSVARLAQVSEQTLEEAHADSTTTQSPVQHYLPPPPDPIAHTEVDTHQSAEDNPQTNDAVIERPSSAASNDTYQQARFLFTDFDGVHYVPAEKGLDIGRRVSLTRPPLASRAESYKQPQAGENMVYYPAPVPMMLNLPPRLSQRPNISERDKRRTQVLDSVPANNRKSAPWLADQDQAAGGDRRRTKNFSDLPPQLRASVFFEPPAASLEIDPTQTSAVAMLDSILDASTTAPVTAFTDHPFAGPVGREVYGSSKQKKLSKDVSAQKKKQRPKSALTLGAQPSNPDFRTSSFATQHAYQTTEAAAAEMHERTSLRENHRDSGSDSKSDSEDDSESSEGEEDEGDEEGEEEEEEEEEEEYDFTAPPTTLLAELEKRKHELKLRRRTAANAAGLHSTLLELDAVAQKQSEHRRQKPVALAWENPDAHNNEGGDDEDVPLGMLFPDQAQAADETRPLGLMERRELEESEPLSKRRARLRGEILPRTPDKRPMTMYSQAVQGPVQDAQDDSGEEEETLGQRLRRLKGQERPVSKADTDFTTEILAELDNLHPEENKDKQEEPSQEEETLAQRRARLKKEADSQQNASPKNPRYRRSMADVLHARRPTTSGNLPSQGASSHSPGTAHQRSFDHRMSMQQYPTNTAPPRTSAGLMQYQAPGMTGPYGYGMAHPNTFYSDAILGMGHLSYAMPNNYHPGVMRQVIDPGQRELIDRWRQSIA